MLWLVAGGLPKTVAWLGAQCAISKDSIEDYNEWVPQTKGNVAAPYPGLHQGQPLRI